MSEATDRTIGGLARREPAPGASRLIRQNRPTPEASAAPVDEPGAAPRPAAAHSTSRTKMTFYLDANLQNRARAAFKATRHLEDDDSFSDMIARALEAEIRRREIQYNDGSAYPGSDDRLAPGRSIS